MTQVLVTGESVPAKESKPPMFAGLDAGARGIADYSTPDSDALLLWYRTAGRYGRGAVELFLARRAIASDWSCTSQQAVRVIRDAMSHVLIPPGRRNSPREGAALAGMRKKEFYRLRATASAWLRAGIMDALYRYDSALR